jgi:hypothetical protein
LLSFPILRSFITVVSRMPASSMTPPQPGQLPPAAMVQFMLAFYAMYFGFFAAFSLYYLAMSTASAFMVPSMALEGLSPRAAFQRMVAFVRQQTGPFFGFIGMRAVLGVVGYMGFALVYEIVFILLALICGLLCWLGYLALHAIHVPMPVLIGLGVIVMFVFLFGVNGYLTFLAMGTFFTFFQAHTLYFLGGRYGLLGELLERSTPPLPPPSEAYAGQNSYPAAPPYAPYPPYPPQQG